MRRGQHTVVTGEIGTRSGYEGCQLSQKLHRLEDEVGGAVSEGVFEFIDDASIRLGGQPVEGQRGPGNVAAQPFETIPLMGQTTDGCVQ